MRNRHYGQYCGLARATEILGHRWTLLILRDLLVQPSRYSDLAAGLSGIPSNLLSSRLKELEGDGLITREARSGTDRSIVYAPTARTLELRPALDALSRWGAGELREPREGEIITEASLVSALRVAAGEHYAPVEADMTESAANPGTTYTVSIGGADCQVHIRDTLAEVAPGPHPSPDLVINGGPGFRDLLAGEMSAESAIAQGVVEVDGDPALLETFVSIFNVPYSSAARN